VQKKLPGKGWEFLVYNKLDKVAATQDANQRNNSPQQWTFTKYDAQGRVAMTGMFTSGSTADGATPPSLANLNSLQNSFNITTAPLWETRDNTTTTGYKNLSLPAGTSYTFYTINYYDDYTTPTGKIPSAFTYVSASSMTRGLPTVSFVDVLTTSNMLCTVSFYDGLGRAAKQFKQHYLGGVLNGGNYDLVTNNYNFDNSPDTIQRDHFTAAGGSTAVVSMLNTYVYDLIGRQKQIKKRINSATDIILVQNDYNEVGQLITKHLHSTNGGTTFLQNTSYAYNERGWLRKINDPASVSSTQAFGEQLYYGDNPTTSLRLYNGSISTIKWQTLIPIGSGIIQQWQNFDYIYDNINRLLSAHYTSQTVADAGAYDEALAYDWNGNIKTLNRWGKPSGIQQIDQLQYTYANSGLSNQLISVNDLSTYSAGQPSGLANYGYAPDLNGNLVTDSKKATTITYNYLSLPQNITQTGNSNTLQFVYTATGQKLRKIYGTAIRDYDDGIEYNNGVIEFVQTEEGRATPGTSYAYEYLIKDHLGNTRATVKQDGKVYQLQDYYAFGMDIPVSAATSPDNRYKYNGKEYENEMALSEYDYGARFYDPVVARWTSPDLLAEVAPSLTPYRYCYNNPISFTDPYGLWETDANGNQTTNKKEDIERLMSYLEIENSTLNTTPDISQISSFVSDEKAGGLGKLTNGNKLLSAVNVSHFDNALTGVGGWKVDQKSFSNFWYQVQGDLTPNDLDPRTWHNNTFLGIHNGLSFAGPDNPKTYSGKEDYTHLPDQIEDIPGYVHDLDFNKLGDKGPNDVFNDPRTQTANAKLVKAEIRISLIPGLSPVSKARAIIIAVGIGAADSYNIIKNTPPDSGAPPLDP
jgi:RHS repeat-associated protein